MTPQQLEDFERRFDSLDDDEPMTEEQANELLDGAGLDPERCLKILIAEINAAKVRGYSPVKDKATET